MGYEDVNPDNTVHVPILNGDISFLNALAHVLLKDHPDVIDWDFIKAHTTGWEAYVEAVTERYSPKQVQDRMGGPNHDVSPELIRQVAGLSSVAVRLGDGSCAPNWRVRPSSAPSPNQTQSISRAGRHPLPYAVTWRGG